MEEIIDEGTVAQAALNVLHEMLTSNDTKTRQRAVVLAVQESYDIKHLGKIARGGDPLETAEVD